MSKKFRSFLSLLLVVILAVSSIATVSVSAVSEADVQSIVNGLTINNDTTKESIEQAIKAVYSDANVSWTQSFYKEAATPTVNVKLKNAGGGYDIYYTSNGHDGVISGVMEVVVNGSAYSAYLYKEIAPEVEEILCDSINESQYYNNSSKDTQVTAVADLIVINADSTNSGKVVVLDNNSLSADTRANAKAVIVKGAICRIGLSSNPTSLGFTNLEGFFTTNYTLRSSGSSFFLQQNAFRNATKLKYVDFGTFLSSGGTDTYFNFAYGVFYGTAIEYFYFNFPNYNIQLNDYAFQEIPNLKQIVVNAKGFTRAATKAFAITDHEVSVIAKNDTIYTSLTNENTPYWSNIKVYNSADATIKGAYDESLQAVIDSIAVSNDTTKESFEASVKSALGVDEITWSKDFIKVAAIPKVEVKLANGNGGYEVYYTSESYAGSVTGEITVTVGYKPCTVEVNRIITPATEEIKCDSIGVAQYTDAGTVYTGEAAELMVVKGRAGDGAAVLKTGWLPAAKLANAKAIIIDGAFRGFENIKQVDSSSNLIGFFAKSSSQANGNWGTPYNSNGGAIHNCPNFKYFYTGAFVDNQGKAINLGGRFISGTSRNNLKYLYFNFPGTQLKVDSYAFAFGNTEQVVFNVGSVTGLAAEKVYASSTNIICTNTDVYNAFKAVTFAGKPKAIYNMEDVEAYTDTLDENIAKLKLGFANVKTFTNATTTDEIFEAIKAQLSDDVSANVESKDIVFEAAVNGGMITLEDVPFAITRRQNGKITVDVTLSKDGVTKIVTVSAPILSTLYYDSTYAFTEADLATVTTSDTQTSITKADGKTKEVYDVLVEGVATSGKLLVLDGNDLGAKDGKKVFVKDSAFEGSSFEAVVLKNVALGTRTFANSTSIKFAYLGDGTTIVKSLWDTEWYDKQTTFGGCTSLKYASYAEGIEKIGQTEFTKTQIEGFVVPTTVKYVRYGAFLNCAYLRTAYFAPEAKTMLHGEDVFNGNSRIVSVRIPEGTTTINKRVFADGSLRTLILPSTLTSIDSTGFNGTISNLVLINYSSIDAEAIGYMFGTTRVPVKIYTLYGTAVHNYANENALDFEIIGDANGDAVLNVLDLIALKLQSLTDQENAKVVYDLNNDGVKANAADLVALKKTVMGIFNVGGDGSNTTIASILIDGKAISDFSVDKYEYTYNLGFRDYALPKISVRISGGSSSAVTIKQATNDDLKAVITCNDKVYTVTMVYDAEETLLDNTYNVLSTEKELNVAFLGGSVTRGQGATTPETKSWAALVHKNLTEKFPDATVNYKNAGIGGTGSVFGTYRVNSDIGLGSFVPDLLFIDYAINDVYDDGVGATEAKKYMESIVNQVYEINENCDIVFVFVTDVYQRNNSFAIRTAHEEVASAYNIPCIYVGETLCDEIIASGALSTSDSSSTWRNSDIWKTYYTDDVHPTDAGYAKYASYVNAFVERILFSKDTVKDIEAAYRPANTLTTLPVNPSIANAKGLTVDGFTVTSDGYMQTEAAGATFTVKFTGTALKLWAWAYNNGGTLVYSIDGGAEKEIAIQRSSTNHRAFDILTGATDTEHTITFTVKQTSGATAKIDIRQFMMEGANADKQFSIN